MAMAKTACVYYLCHIDNLATILERGVLSRSKVEQEEIAHSDIHHSGVLGRRDKQLPNGRMLKEYVNLYFCARNAMLYRVICNLGRENLIILQIDPAIIQSPDTYVSDRNAAASSAHFYPARDYQKIIDFKILKKAYWSDSDDTKQRMMAEVLVPDQIASDKIIGIFLHKPNHAIASLAAAKRVEVSVEPKLFFRPTYLERIEGTSISLSMGDMFFSSMQTFTISVNIVGVMGRGLASRTKYQFPDAYVRYQDDCKHKKLRIGKPTLYKRATRIEEELADNAALLQEEELNGARWFLFFPTKRHWRENSRLDDIEQSLQWLVDHYLKEGIQSIALPALGCGLGNLQWRDVGPLMCRYLNRMSIRSCIYLPMEHTPDQKYLSAEYLLENCNG